MPADDNAPTPDAPAVRSPDPAPSGRRRRSRSWSTPGAAPAESFERPLTERDWNRNTTAAPAAVPPPPPAPAASPLPSAPPAPGKVPIAAPPPPAGRIAGAPVGATAAKPVAPGATKPAAPTPSATTTTPAGPTDLAGLTTLVTALQAEVTGMRKELTSRDAGLVTGAELAASIEALGTTLGTGLANLLTELRNLLARDLEAAADRVVHEVGQHLRTSSAQIVDGVEERAQAIATDGLGELTALLDQRLEQVEEDVSGLRAVVLEIPDQTQVVARLDQLVGSTPEPRAAAPTPSPAPRRRAPLRPDPPVLTDPFAPDDDDGDDADEPIIPVTAPARRAKKAPLRATPAPKAAEPAEVTPKRRTKAIKAAAEPEEAEEPAKDDTAAKAKPVRAPRTARAAGISADVEVAHRAGRRGKR